MNTLPWTKFQDFYLRLGFLKVLMAVLSPDRRSALNDAIVRRLEKPLFSGTNVATTSPTRSLTANRAKAGAVRDRSGSGNVVERLLLDGRCPSLLYAVTERTAYKIVDWGRDAALIGRGNQITERGLLLRNLQDDTATAAFFAGNIAAWNPFQLTLAEKMFLLFHLCEIDGVIFELIKDLGNLSDGTILESNEAGRMTSDALLRVLAGAKDHIQAKDVLKFRIACDLANTIAGELGTTEIADRLLGAIRRKVPKKFKFSSIKSRGIGRSPRRTTKNVDHQTIPRFEQLVDLGFLAKPMANSTSEAESEAARKRWRYMPTETCRRWYRAMQGVQANEGQFLWHGFATTFSKAFDITPRTDAVISDSTIAEYSWKAYRSIQRRAGVNPLESVALFAMILATLDGICLEMGHVHRFFLAIKQHDRLPDHVSFASGNELDRMFVHIKPGFLEQFQTIHT